MNDIAEGANQRSAVEKRAIANGQGLSDATKSESPEDARPDATDSTVDSQYSDAEQDVQQNDVRSLRKRHETRSMRRRRKLEDDLKKLTNSELRAAYPHEANSHRNMKSRCKSRGYVLDRDFEDFRDFLAIMGPMPDESYTIDRIDPNNPEYSQENARWASKKLQSTNRRNARYLATKDGTELTVAEWSRRSEIPEATIRRRHDVLGWSIDDAVSVPVDTPYSKRKFTGGHPRYQVEPYINQWRRSLDEHHGQSFFSPTAKEGAMIKKLVMRFDRENVAPPSDILERVLENWSDFTAYSSEMYGAFSPPTVPTIEFLTKYCNAAGNWYVSVTDGIDRVGPESEAADQPQALPTRVEEES